MSDTLEFWMNRQEAEIPKWQQPEQYDLNDTADRREMHQRLVGSAAKVERRVAQIADDLFELRHPDQKKNQTARRRFVSPIVETGDRYGKWHYFSWSNRFVQYPDAEQHRELLTFRNRELLTADELRKLGQATVAHVGLSVGAHILEQTSHMALGNKVILADPDILSVPNLNRIAAGMLQIGMRKTDAAGIKLSELNPYVEQIHLPHAVSEQDADTFYLNRPDLIFEEVDHLPTKILMRKFAYRAGSPLIMATDTGDKSMIDVERYDLGDLQPFLGALSDAELKMIEASEPTSEQTVRLIMRLIGYENISVRLAKSMGQIGLTLGGIAQLGTTASVGGAYAAVAGREILLGRGPATGRYRVSPQEIMKLRHI